MRSVWVMFSENNGRKPRTRPVSSRVYGNYSATRFSPFLVFQPNDFSISLKAQSKNKHFKVQLKESLYCIGQRKFNSMEELVEHYKKAPIFTSEQGDKLYLVKALSAS